MPGPVQSATGLTRRVGGAQGCHLDAVFDQPCANGLLGLERVRADQDVGLFGSAVDAWL
jgi:hypothetical protein